MKERRKEEKEGREGRKRRKEDEGRKEGRKEGRMFVSFPLFLFPLTVQSHLFPLPFLTSYSLPLLLLPSPFPPSFFPSFLLSL
jgi:hypothetical protein